MSETSTAIVVGSIIIAGAILFANHVNNERADQIARDASGPYRFQVTQGALVHRLNTKTGHVEMCFVHDGNVTCRVIMKSPSEVNFEYLKEMMEKNEKQKKPPKEG